MSVYTDGSYRPEREEGTYEWVKSIPTRPKLWEKNEEAADRAENGRQKRKTEVEKENNTEHTNTIHEHEQERKAETGTYDIQKHKK